MNDKTHSADGSVPDPFVPSDNEPFWSVDDSPTTSSADTISLPRMPFLVGAGVVAIVIASLAALWLTGGDDSSTKTEDGSPSAKDADADGAAQLRDEVRLRLRRRARPHATVVMPGTSSSRQSDE